jgi:hypothetical protein
MLLLLQQLWLLLHHRSLLGTRSDNATRQNESRRRERQNVLLHLKSPQRHTCPSQNHIRASILFAEETLENTFDFAHKLLRMKGPQEFVEIQTGLPDGKLRYWEGRGKGSCRM